MTAGTRKARRAFDRNTLFRKLLEEEKKGK